MRLDATGNQNCIHGFGSSDSDLSLPPHQIQNRSDLRVTGSPPILVRKISKYFRGLWAVSSGVAQEPGPVYERNLVLYMSVFFSPSLPFCSLSVT